MLLADIVDILSGILYIVSKLAGGKPHKPKPVERPGKQKKVEHYGSGGMKVSDLRDWIFKRKK